MKTKTSVWRCSYCNKEFKYDSEKRRHEQSHAPQFECKVCSKKFSFVSALRRHEKQHDRKESVQCSECGRKFRDQTLLKRHKQYAHKGTYECQKCSAIFNSEAALKTHMKTHKPKSERMFRCRFERCGKTFNFAHHLKHHELTHTNHKPHKCKECGKCFIQLHHFKVHQRVHKPDSWLTCEDCSKEFTNEYALRRHLARHKTKPRQEHAFQDDAKDIQKLSITVSEKDTKHITNNSIENSVKDESLADIVEIEDIDVNQHFSSIDVAAAESFEEFSHKVDMTNDKMDILDDEILSTSNYCTSVLGKCIVTGETEANESCLCAQMNFEDTNNEFVVSPDNIVKSNVKLMDDISCIEKRLKNLNACETCECVSICGIKDKSLKTWDSQETPKIEIRNDGIIKIQDTFDFDFGNVQNCTDKSFVKENLDLNAKVNILNSCQDILGNCIVSGDGTIGEGCLCAKMSANDQQMIAQEIEEITPCPKSNWFKQEM